MRNRWITAGVLYRTAAVFLLLYMLLFPKETYRGAVDGLLLWYRNLLPVQFPFFMATALLRKTGGTLFMAKWMGTAMERLFHASKESVAAVAAGWIAGYPAGTQTAVALYENRKIDEQEYMHLLTYCNVPGPLFVITTVGERMLGNIKLGYVILFAQIAAAILCGVLMRPRMYIRKSLPHENMEKSKTLGQLLSESIEEASHAIVMVGGFVVLCSVLLVKLAVIPGAEFLEMANGCSMFAQWDTVGKLGAIAFLLGWGGGCVQLQIAAFAEKGPKIENKIWYIRIFQGILAAIIVVFLTGFMNM